MAREGPGMALEGSWGARDCRVPRARGPARVRKVAKRADLAISEQNLLGLVWCLGSDTRKVSESVQKCTFEDYWPKPIRIGLRNEIWRPGSR